jgi:hypothetical protein
MAAVRSDRVHHQHRRSEASCPATSAAVAAARADDALRQRPRGLVQVRERDQGPLSTGHQHLHHHHHQLRRSAAFPPRRPGPGRRPPQRCESDLNIREHRSCSEVAGGTAAGCAAVCCCFPCVMVEVAVLATVRAPAALCRKAARVRKGRRRSASAGQATEIYELLVDDTGVVEVDAGAANAVALPVKPALQLEEKGELEKEVWARFYGTGFWRSPSQLDDNDDR